MTKALISCKKRKSKKGLSVAKRKNIRYNKLSKQGKIRKNKTQQKDKLNSKKISYHELQIEKKKREASARDDITGDEMLGMVGEDDLHTLGLKTREPDLKDLEQMEKEGRQFREEIVKIGKNKKIKQLLPVFTGKDWTEKRAVVVEKAINLEETSFSHYKKKPKTTEKVAEKDDEEAMPDTGMYDDDNDPQIQRIISTKTDLIRDLEVSCSIRKTSGSVASMMAERERRLQLVKLKVSSLATNLMQDSTKIHNIRGILDFLKFDGVLKKHDYSAKRYIFLSVLQLLHDIIPNYRVQENVMNNRMKKTTVEQAKQELTLLHHYRGYLRHIELTLGLLKKKKNRDNMGLKMLGETCLRCLGDLLVLHPRFNYSVNIINALVPYLNSGNLKLRTSALESLAQAIKTDASNCFVTVEIISRVYKLAQLKRFEVKKEVLELFFALPLNKMKNVDAINDENKEADKTMQNKQKIINKLVEQAKVKPSRKQLKERKKMAKIREEMAETEANQVMTEQNVRHSKILEYVFGVYFHILKKKTRSKLFSVVLDGLSRFSHLINIEFFSDMLAVLDDLLKNKDLSATDTLHCIKTIFTVLSGQGEALNIDPHRFYSRFYNVLVDFNRDVLEKNIKLVLRIFEVIFLETRRMISDNTVLSFAKRLSTIAVTALPHQTAIPALVILKRILTKYRCTEALLDVSLDGSSGDFNPDVEEPEHSNPPATALWEICANQSNYHPKLQQLSKNILSATLMREDPNVLEVGRKLTKVILEEYDTAKKFNPRIQKPEIHLRGKKKIPKKHIAQFLSLNNLELQEICEKYYEESLLNNKNKNTNLAEDLNMEIDLDQNIDNSAQYKKASVTFYRDFSNNVNDIDLNSKKDKSKFFY